MINQLETNQHSKTVNPLALFVMSATLLCPIINLTRLNLDKKTNYISDGNSSTFSESTDLYSINTALDITFEQTTKTFYSELLANQEPLGKEFESVLYDNLWDLYES